MKKIYLLFIFAFVSFIYANAQSNDILDSLVTSKTSILSDSATTEKLNNLSLSYYTSKNTLDRNYSFELYNKQRRLRMWSNEVSILGYVAFLGVCFAGPVLFPDASLSVLVPAETVVGGGLLIGAVMWSNNLKKKADAIKESSVSILDINKKSNLYICHYSTELNRNTGLGIGYKMNF